MAMQALSIPAHQSLLRLRSEFYSINEAQLKRLHGRRQSSFKFAHLGSLPGTSRSRASSVNEISSAAAGSSSRSTSGSEVSKADVVVIGAGIGGLCCAALLAKYGYQVVVCESHDVAGGAGHAFERGGFVFDSGPSFHAGLSIQPSINPLKQV